MYEFLFLHFSFLISHFPKLHFPIFRCHAAPDCVDTFFYYKYFAATQLLKLTAKPPSSILQSLTSTFHFSLFTSHFSLLLKKIHMKPKIFRLTHCRSQENIYEFTRVELSALNRYPMREYVPSLHASFREY